MQRPEPHPLHCAAPGRGTVPRPQTWCEVVAKSVARADGDSLGPRAGPRRTFPADGGGARLRAAGGRRLAVRAQVGRLSRDPRERRRRARALVAEGAAAAALLPGAPPARRPAPAPLRARRRDRDRPGRRPRLRLDADAAPPGREPSQPAGEGDPGRVHRVRRPPLEGQAAPRASAEEAAGAAGEAREGLPALPLHA